MKLRMVFEESTARGLARRPYDLPTTNEVFLCKVEIPKTGRRGVRWR